MIRDVKGKIAEIDNVLKVVQRYAASLPAGDKGKGNDNAQVHGRIGILAKPVPRIRLFETVREAMHQAVKDSPGSKLSALLPIAARLRGKEVKSTTAGNALWHLKNAGEVSRAGQKWFPVNKTTPKAEANGAS